MSFNKPTDRRYFRLHIVYHVDGVYSLMFIGYIDYISIQYIQPKSVYLRVFFPYMNVLLTPLALPKLQLTSYPLDLVLFVFDKNNAGKKL